MGIIDKFTGLTEKFDLLKDMSEVYERSRVMGYNVNRSVEIVQDELKDRHDLNMSKVDIARKLNLDREKIEQIS